MTARVLNLETDDKISRKLHNWKLSSTLQKNPIRQRRNHKGNIF